MNIECHHRDCPSHQGADDFCSKSACEASRYELHLFGRIRQLETQLTEESEAHATAMNECHKRLAEEVERRFEGNRIASDEWREEVVKFQAREVVLRAHARQLIESAYFGLHGSLFIHSGPRDVPSDAVSTVRTRKLLALRDALSKPSDDTILRDVIAFEKREALESAAMLVDGDVQLYGSAIATFLRNMAQEIKP